MENSQEKCLEKSVILRGKNYQDKCRNKNEIKGENRREKYLGRSLI